MDAGRKSTPRDQAISLFARSSAGATYAMMHLAAPDWHRSGQIQASFASKPFQTVYLQSKLDSLSIKDETPNRSTWRGSEI
jgi:hypothetical protein